MTQQHDHSGGGTALHQEHMETARSNVAHGRKNYKDMRVTPRTLVFLDLHAKQPFDGFPQ